MNEGIKEGWKLKLGHIYQGNVNSPERSEGEIGKGSLSKSMTEQGKRRNGERKERR